MVMVHLACAELCSAGLDGQRLNYRAEDHTKAAVALSSRAVSHGDVDVVKCESQMYWLTVAAQLAQYDAMIQTAISFPTLVDPRSLLLSTQLLIDSCIANASSRDGFSELAGKGCAILADIWMNCFRNEGPGKARVLISLWEDAVRLMEIDNAQDSLASAYYRLEMMCYYARDLD